MPGAAYDLQRYTRLREIAADLAAALAAALSDAVRSAVLAETGYLTPKMDVRAAVHDEAGRVLVVREVCEESGCLVEGVRLLGIYDKCR